MTTEPDFTLLNASKHKGTLTIAFQTHIQFCNTEILTEQVESKA